MSRSSGASARSVASITTRGTAQYVPFPAVSSLGGFRTPAVVRVETFVAAGVRKPSQERKFATKLEAAASKGPIARGPGIPRGQLTFVQPSMRIGTLRR